MTETVYTKGNAITRALRNIGRALYETYRLGGTAVVAAPLLLAFAVLTEAVQHIVEIRLGMFESVAAFRALGNDPLRWMFGYTKVAGFLISILTIARFWATGSVKAALLIPLGDLGRLIFAIVLTLGIALSIDWVQSHGLPRALDIILSSISFILQTGLTLYVVGALFGDRAMTLRRSFTDRFPTAIIMTLTMLAAFAPCQALHMLNHKIAIGGPTPLVWAMMAFDSLWIGLFAALVGSAMYAGYKSGLTWRGWATPNTG